MGVDEAKEVKDGDSDAFDAIGAGDQGMMFGYATNETDDYMPLPISLAHRLARRLAKVRKDGTLPYLRPDGKTQVTVEYDNGRPVRIDTIVISAQHSPEITREQIEKDLLEYVIKPELADGLFDDKTKLFINPTGRFVIGGPQGDSGLTGRKIIVDTYGGMARHGSLLPKYRGAAPIQRAIYEGAHTSGITIMMLDEGMHIVMALFIVI